MIDLIRDKQVWTRNQIRKRTEAYIQQAQTHGDELILNRINDAALLNLRPTTEGETAWRDTLYLPRAMEAGALAEQMVQLNAELAKLLAIEGWLAGYASTTEQLTAETIPEQVEDENGELTPNPAYTALVQQQTDTLNDLSLATPQQWRLVAQRKAGAEIEDLTKLHLAVVAILPTIELLEAYVEVEGLASVDTLLTLETAKQVVVEALTPVEEETDDVANPDSV